MSLGFIILRCVNTKVTDSYWIECYNCIRKFYPTNKIIIIDDNSDYTLVSNHVELEYTTVINSEFKGAGEILPYYYYLKNNLFDRAVVLHDSVFIQKHVDFGTFDRFLWEFNNHSFDNIPDETRLINAIGYDNENLLKFYHDQKWYGCFGVMSIISFNFLTLLDKKYNFLNLVTLIKNRQDRMALERVFACIFIRENDNRSIFGDIHKFHEWGYRYEEYSKNINRPSTDIIKVFSGR